MAVRPRENFVMEHFLVGTISKVNFEQPNQIGSPKLKWNVVAMDSNGPFPANPMSIHMYFPKYH
jgi:hypothetical protein